MIKIKAFASVLTVGLLIGCATKQEVVKQSETDPNFIEFEPMDTESFFIKTDTSLTGMVFVPWTQEELDRALEDHVTDEAARAMVRLLEEFMATDSSRTYNGNFWDFYRYLKTREPLVPKP